MLSNRALSGPSSPTRLTLQVVPLHRQQAPQLQSHLPKPFPVAQLQLHQTIEQPRQQGQQWQVVEATTNAPSASRQARIKVMQPSN